MNVGELVAKLSRLDPTLPVVFDVEDPELVGSYVEVMAVEFTDHDVRFDDGEFSLDGSRPYTRPSWGSSRDAAKPCEPVALLACRLPWQPTIDGEVVRPALQVADARSAVE